MSASYEIERKYLVKMPIFPLPEKDAASEITQTYLVTPPEISERVRCRDGRYTHTRKVRVSGIKAKETEEIIDRAQYEALLQKRDPALRSIQKVRHVFAYRGQTFELDVFPFWKKQAMLEIELEKEDTPVDFPSFLSCIREVTDDPAYKNQAMARQIPEE